MESIEHYEKRIESKIKLLRGVNKKTEEIIEGKQITEIERHKILFATKLDEIEELKTKVIGLKYIKDEEMNYRHMGEITGREKEMLKDQLVKLQQESKII